MISGKQLIEWLSGVCVIQESNGREWPPTSLSALTALAQQKYTIQCGHPNADFEQPCFWPGLLARAKSTAV